MRITNLTALAAAMLISACSQEAPPPTSPPAMTGEAADALVFGFCYSVQAAGNCDDISLRIDTESKIAAKIGGKFREQGNHHPACLDGYDQANAEIDKGLCVNAKTLYGCNGSKIANLNQGAIGSEGPFCQFN